MTVKVTGRGGNRRFTLMQRGRSRRSSNGGERILEVSVESQLSLILSLSTKNSSRSMASLTLSDLVQLTETCSCDAYQAEALCCTTGLVTQLLEIVAAADADDRGEDGGSSATTAAVDGDTPAQQLQMHAAYLLSALAGKAVAIDARMLSEHAIPVLAAAAAAGSSGLRVQRGVLRALAKMLAAQPACAGAQLMACSSLPAVAALLGSSCDSCAWGGGGGDFAAVGAANSSPQCSTDNHCALSTSLQASPGDAFPSWPRCYPRVQWRTSMR